MIGIPHPEAFLLVPLWGALAWLFPKAGLLRPARLACGLLLLAAALDPHLDVQTPGTDLWVLVDRSRSAEESVAPRLPELFAILEQSRGPHDRLHVVDFAQEAVHREAQSYSVPLPGARDATLGANAVRHALMRSDRGRNRRLLMLTDGQMTEPLEEVGELLERERVPLDLRVFPAPMFGDVWVEEFTAPTQVRAGEPFLLEARVRGPAGASARYRLLRDGELQQEGMFVFRDGGPPLRWTDLLPVPGASRYEVWIEKEGDPRPDNNRLVREVEASGRNRILLVTAFRDDPLTEVLRGAGFEVDVEVEPARLLEGRLSGASALLINNVPAHRVPAEFLEAVPFFVQGQGGGLVMFGGEGSFGSGGYFDSPIDPLLPVSMELKEEDRKLAVAMGIALDRSGSMSASVGGVTKMELANAGAARALELLGDLDALTVFAVDTEAHRIVPLRRVGRDRAKLAARVRSIRSTGGGIYVRNALEAVETELSKAPQGQRHVILFADAADAEQPEGVPELMERMAEAGMTLSVIALGTEGDADAAFLRATAEQGGGLAFFCGDASMLPAVFAQETVRVSRAAFVEEETGVREEAGWREVAETAPTWPVRVGGYNLSYLRDGAAQSLVGTDAYAAPLLAHWQRGAGRVAAVSFPMAGDHSDAIRAWLEYGDFARTLVRWAARPELPPGLALRLRRVGATLRLELHADAAWQERFTFEPPLLTTASSVDTEPREHGWRRIDPGFLRTEIVLRGEERVRGALRVGGMTLPFGPVMGEAGLEARPDPAMLRRLRQLSARSGGEERVDLGGAWTPALRPVPRGFRNGFLVALLLLFLAEAWMFRLQGRRPEWEGGSGGFQVPTRHAKAVPKQGSPPLSREPPPPPSHARGDLFRRARKLR